MVKSLKKYLILFVLFSLLFVSGCEKKENTNGKDNVILDYSNIMASAIINKNNEFGFKEFKFSENKELNFKNVAYDAEFKMYFTLNDVNIYSSSYKEYEGHYKFQTYKTEKYNGFVYSEELHKNYAHVILELEKNDEAIYLLHMEIIDNNIEADEYVYNFVNSDSMKKFISSIEINTDYKKYKSNRRDNAKKENDNK